MPAKYMGVRKRGRRWYFTYTYHDDAGQLRQREERAIAAGYPDTAEGARDARIARLAAIHAGDAPVPSLETVTDAIERYIAARYDLGGSTIYSYRRWLAGYIASDPLGNRPLVKLTRGDIAAWHGRLIARGLSPATIAGPHALVSGALSMAVGDRVIRDNPARRATPPRIPTRDLEVWDGATVRRWLLATAEHDYAALWRLLVTTGLRLGELLALRWVDIDLAAARLSVRQNRTRSAEGRPVMAAPKRDSYRTVDLLPDDVTALRDQHDRQRGWQRRERGWQDSGLVFTRRDGTPLLAQTVRRWLHQLCDEAGVPDATPHALRHVHGSLLGAAGVAQKTIASRMGHRRVSSTDHYMHATPAMHREAVDRLGAALSGEATDQQQPAVGEAT